MKRILLALVAFVALLSSCGSGSKQQTAQTEEQLRIGVMPSVDYLPLAVGLEQSYFDSLGLKLELVHFSSPMERDAALQAGEIDGTISDYTTVLMQNQKGLPVQLLFSTNGMFSFITQPKASIDSLAALKGKKVGLSSNTVIEYATDLLLTEAGLATSDIQKVEVQKIPLRLEMIAQGELDAAVLPQPFAQIALAKGLKAIPGVLDPQGGQLNITGLALHSTQVKDKGEAIKRLVAGYNQAIEYLNTTPQATWAPIVARELKVEEGLVAKMSFGTFKPAVSPSKEDISKTAAWLQSKELVPASYTGQEAIMPLP